MNGENEDYSSKSRTSDQKDQKATGDIIKTKVPLHMVDFQFMATIIAMMIVFIITSLIDHLYRSIWTYLSVILTILMMLTLFYLLTRYEFSIYNDSLTVKKPFFREVKISAEKIIGISDFNNSIYKYRKAFLLIMVFMILIITIMQVSNSYRMIESYGIENSTNIAMTMFLPLMFAILFYNTYQMSHYPKAIKIDIDPGEIKLYPENEEKYLLLKERLDSLLR
ncbi:MAG: hypothetical protein RBT65_00045 [Methanolobus sp.]|nr:hypothetical protein [Methanolobus sp.]